MTCACGIVFASTALAADWEPRLHIPGDGIHGAMLAVDCPSVALCVAVGESDWIASSATPTVGATWHVVEPVRTAPPDSCACTGPERQASRAFRDVSCPSPGLCVAVTFDGEVFSSTNPTGGAESWHDADIDGTARDTHLMSVSCPTASLCVAVSGDRYTAGKVLSTADPTGGAAAWKVVQLDETLDFRGVSCGSPSLCVAVARHGRLLVSTNPTGGPSSWRELGTPGGPGDLQGVSCAATPFCVVGNAGGNLLLSSAPNGTPSLWREENGGSKVQITGVSCLASGQCAAVDNNGNVTTTADAPGGSGWSSVSVLPFVDTPQGQYPLNALFGISCPTSFFCAASGADGRVFTSGNPFATNGARHGSGRVRHPRRPRVTISDEHAGYQVRSARTKSPVYFRFHANGKAKGYLCSRDGVPFKPCHSPVRYRAAVGPHVFRVRAVGITGLRGPIVTRRFRIEVNPNHHPRP